MRTSANAGSGMVWCTGVVVVGVGTPHDVGDGPGMFFAVQRDSICDLTLPIVADGGLHVRFENSTHRKSLTVLQLFIQRPGDDLRSSSSSSFMTLWCIPSTSPMIRSP
jgi:hypothetical protein